MTDNHRPTERPRMRAVITVRVAFDADNYACVKGSCQYLGCNTDVECGALYHACHGLLLYRERVCGPPD